MVGKKNRILGIDPGSRIVGFALLEKKRESSFNPRDFVIVDAGVLRADLKLSINERLGSLHNALNELVMELQPTICVFEKSFSGDNISTGIKLGLARGALMTAVMRCNVAIEEVSPTQVKKNIAGHGRTSKEDLSLALKALLGFERGLLPHDSTDAIAVALSFGLQMGFHKATEKFKTLGVTR